MRPWNIAEQVVVEPSTKLRFEFTSEHSRAVAVGEPPTYHDRAVMLNVYNEAGTRVIRLHFTRGGQMVGVTVENVEGEQLPKTEQERIAELVKPYAPDPPAQGGADPATWDGVNVAGQFASDI